MIRPGFKNLSNGKILLTATTAITFAAQANAAYAQVPANGATTNVVSSIASDKFIATDLRDGISKGQVSIVVTGDGVTTTKAQIFLKNNSSQALRVVIPENTLLKPSSNFLKTVLPGLPGSQTMLIRASSVVYLPKGDALVSTTMRAYCVSMKSVPPPQKVPITNPAGPSAGQSPGQGQTGAVDQHTLFDPKNPSYVALGPGGGENSFDVDQWQKLVNICSAGDALENSEKFKRVKVGSDSNARTRNITQLALWKVLGEKSTNPADHVTSDSIVGDQEKALANSASTDAQLLEKIKGTGAKITYKNNKLESIQLPKEVQKKFVDSSEELLGAIDLTIAEAKDGNVDQTTVSLPLTVWNSFYDTGARAYRDGDFVEGDTLLSAAVDESKTYGEADKRYSLSLLTRGELQSDSANYMQADALLSQSLNLRSKVSGQKSIEAAEVRNDLGVLNQREGEFKKADDYFVDAYEAAKAGGPKSSAFVVHVLDNYGRNLLQDGDSKTAQAKLQEAMALSLAGNNKVTLNPELAEIETYLAKAKLAPGPTQDLSSAEQLLDRAYELAQVSMGQAHPFLAVILDAQSSLYGNMHDDSRSSGRKELAVRALGPLPDTMKKIVCSSDLSYDTLNRLKKFSVDKYSIACNRENLDSLASGAKTEIVRAKNTNPIGDKWAVVIGISKFRDKSIDLKYSAKDAKDFADFLVAKQNFSPDHVHVLLDDQATLQHIKSEIGDKFLANYARKNDMVVIYLSSHGSSDKVDRRGANFFVAYDTDKNDLYATGLQMPNLMQMIRERVDCDRVAVLLDACHSGALQKTGAKGLFRTNNFDASEISQGTGQLVLCSSQSDESSWESLRYNNGVFTHYLMDALKDGQSKNMEQVYKEMCASVSEEVQHDRNESQKPVLSDAGWQGESLVLSAVATDKRAGAPQANVAKTSTDVTTAKSAPSGSAKVAGSKTPGAKAPTSGAKGATAKH